MLKRFSDVRERHDGGMTGIEFRDVDFLLNELLSMD